jgi:LysM repeat protein
MAFAPEVVLKRIQLKARKGDTLDSFAAKNGVSVSNLLSWNKLNAHAPLKVGQSITLLIPTTQGRATAKASPGKGLPDKPVQAKGQAATGRGHDARTVASARGKSKPLSHAAKAQPAQHGVKIAKK